MGKRGQLQLSFGMIFSVIIIAVTLFVAIYIIMNFLKFRDCSQIDLYYDGLQQRVNKIYGASEGASTNHLFQLPSSIDYVCFGSLSQSTSLEDRQIQDSLRNYYGANAKGNAFIYPNPAKCGRRYGMYSLNHSSTTQFFCKELEDKGKSSIRLTFDPFDTSVNILK
jgi:hypothetical protein